VGRPSEQQSAYGTSLAQTTATYTYNNNGQVATLKNARNYLTTYEMQDWLTQHYQHYRITETFRGIAEQDRLYAQGRTTPGAIVTNAPGGSSPHNYGLAFDIAMFDMWDRNRYLTEISDPEYQLAARVGEAVGLAWGGRFTSPVDGPHFEFTNGLTMQQVRANVTAGRDPLCSQ
jgi:hypothetical protein